MPIIKSNHVAFRGVATVLPEKKIHIDDVDPNHYINMELIERLKKNVGIEYLYEANPETTGSDLAYVGAEKLIEKLGWPKDSIDGLVYSTETPDYVTPAISCILQQRLGIKSGGIAFDVTSGCPGSINATALGTMLIESGACKRVLVLLGNTVRRTTSIQDYGLAFLISDAGAVFALEHTDELTPMTTVLHADGSGYECLIIPASGTRNPRNSETCLAKEDQHGNLRSDEQYFMDGKGVFDFAVKNVPHLIEEALEAHEWTKDNVDQFIVHQPNAYMLKLIIQRSKIEKEKVLINIQKYGNTSNASLAFIMLDLNRQGKLNDSNVLMTSFGGGLYTGAIAAHIDKMVCVEIQL